MTHDQVEAMALADRIAVMSGGKILQIGGGGNLIIRLRAGASENSSAR